MADEWVQEQLEKFMFDFDEADKDESGSLSFSEVCDVLQAQGFNGDRKEAWAIFKDFDLDEDQSVSRDEFEAGVRKLPKMNIAEFYLRKMFTAMDKDASGTLSGPEIKEASEGLQDLDVTSSTLSQVYAAFSGDSDGKLNYEEFLRVFKVESEAGVTRQIFSRLDLDKSGYVQMGELFKAVQSDSELQSTVGHMSEMFLVVREEPDRKIRYEDFDKMWRKARK